MCWAAWRSAALAGGATNTLELGSAASAGTLSGLGSSFVDFGTVTVDSGAQWALAGNNTLASGGTLINSGTLDASAGTLFIDPATLDNSGSIAGPVTLGSGGYLHNEGGGTISGSAIAVYGTGGAGSVANAGAILGEQGTAGTPGGAGGAGVDLSAGGNIGNTGTIAGGNGGRGVYGSLSGGAGGLGGAGIDLSAGGNIGNTGTIAGGNGGRGGYGYDGGGAGGLGGAGIDLSAGGSIANAGIIIAGSGGNGGGSGGGTAGANGVAGAGIVLAAGGIVSNGSLGSAGALISGRTGIEASGTAGATVTNYGTIVGSSGVAVSFAGGGANLLALGSLYHLTGTVAGSTAAGATDTLELLETAGYGITVDYNGLGLTNFENVLFGSGGTATLLVSNISGTLGITISGFDATDETIDLTGITSGTITCSDTATNHG